MHIHPITGAPISTNGASVLAYAPEYLAIQYRLNRVNIASCQAQANHARERYKNTGNGYVRVRNRRRRR